VNRETEPDRDALADFTYRVVIAVAIVGLAALAWYLSDIFVLIFGAVLLASVLRTLAVPLARYGGIPDRWALAIVVVAVAAGLALLGWLIGAQVAAQMRELVDILPSAAARAREWVMQSALGAAALELAERSMQEASGALSGLARFANLTFGIVANVVLIVFLALYFAADPRLYARGLVHLIPHAVRPRFAVALAASGAALRRWLLGQFVAMIIVGVVTGFGLWMLDVPLALSLALIAGVLEFIPFIGPILSAVPAVLVAFTHEPMTPVYVALLYLGVQQIEGNVLMPLIQRWAVKLPPALSLIGAVVFGVLFGVLGVLFATPLMVVVMVLVQKLYVEGALEEVPVSGQERGTKARARM
jgi:predicted PurR-regulated permease PerM